MIAVTEKESLRIDTWLMSCRILGRRVEEVMLASLMGYAKAHMCQCLIGEYIPTAKNSQVRDLFDRLGFDRIAEEPNGVRRYSCDARRSGLVAPGFIQIDDSTQVQTARYV
jgi:predicted enzyme involved in methoxymalonyl-ACP biosynthesis